jgi:8-oxo-dGTP diphosphatase
VTEGYDPTRFPPFAVTVDVVVLTLVERALHVLLVERGGEPYAGRLALPGGFVKPDESLDAAAARELREETGIEAADHLEQLGTYGDPDRDPRMRVVTVAYLAVLRQVRGIEAGTDAVAARLVPVRRALAEGELAFDHHQILEEAVEALREKLAHTSLATAFVGPEFTLSELRSVYEAGWDTELDPGNFRRKVLAMNALVAPTGRTRPPGPEGGKPPEVYRAAAAASEPLPSPVRPPAAAPRARRGSGSPRRKRQQ